MSTDCSSLAVSGGGFDRGCCASGGDVSSAESPPDEVEVRFSASHRVQNTVKWRVRGVVWASFWTVCPRR